MEIGFLCSVLMPGKFNYSLRPSVNVAMLVPDFYVLKSLERKRIFFFI